MIIEFVKFFIYASLIVLISKYILVVTLRKLAEEMNLKAKSIGKIAGVATSIPELLTVSISSFNGLIGTSIFNILSSNVINLIQYMLAIFLNKNQKILKNQAIKLDLFFVFITILLPIILLIMQIEIRIEIVPIWIALYGFFRFLDHKVHQQYLPKERSKIEETRIEKRKKNKRKIILYLGVLLIAGILLFLIGNTLGKTLENLCIYFGISQMIIGILLGSITSIPELITFFEAQKHYQKQNEDQILGVVEATNNLLTSNLLNLFVIQSIGILFYVIF